MVGNKESPWWVVVIPDVRGWAMVGFFILTFFLLLMIDHNPLLLANASFMQFAGTLMAGGILLIANNLFGGTKSGVEASTKNAEAIQALAATGTGTGNGAPQPVVVTNRPSDPVKTEAVQPRDPFEIPQPPNG